MALLGAWELGMDGAHALLLAGVRTRGQWSRVVEAKLGGAGVVRGRADGHDAEELGLARSTGGRAAGELGWLGRHGLRPAASREMQEAELAGRRR